MTTCFCALKNDFDFHGISSSGLCPPIMHQLAGALCFSAQRYLRQPRVLASFGIAEIEGKTQIVRTVTLMNLDGGKSRTCSSHTSLARSSLSILVVSTSGAEFFFDSTTSEHMMNMRCFRWCSLWYNCARRLHRSHTEKFWNWQIGKRVEINNSAEKL